MPWFWTHRCIPIQFILVVDESGVKYTGKGHAKHTMIALKEDYKISTNWEGEIYWTDLELGLPRGQGTFVNAGVCRISINTGLT